MRTEQKPELRPVLIAEADVETIERLADAAIRLGHTRTAVEGYALALRLREEAKRWRTVT